MEQTTDKEQKKNSVPMRQDINFAQATVNSECKTKESVLCSHCLDDVLSVLTGEIFN